MKRVMAVLFFLSAYGVASAGDEDDPCLWDYEIAEMMMDSRQAGVSMPSLMKVGRNFGTGVSGQDVVQAEAASRFVIEVVRSAFDVSLYYSKSSKARAIKEFSNAWYAACLREYDEGD
jgi:hypothetical protein